MRRIFCYLLFFISILNLYSQTPVDITFIANDGFLLNDGEHKILIDAIFSEGSGSFTTPPADALVQERNAEAPFDSITFFLNTHQHADHINYEYAIEHMVNDDSTIFLCPNFVYDTLSTLASFSIIEDRIIPKFPNEGTKTDTSINGFRFRIVNLVHYNNLSKSIQNLGYIFELGNISVFHPGDAYMNDTTEIENLNLAADSTDILFLSYRVLDNDFENLGRKIIEYLNPKAIILMHIKVNEAEEYSNLVAGLQGLPPIYIMEEQMSNYRFIKSGDNLILDDQSEIKSHVKASFTIFPNPASGNITVQFENSVSSKIQVSLYDIAGQLLVYKNTISNENQVALNLNPFPHGLYMIAITEGSSFYRQIICHE